MEKKMSYVVKTQTLENYGAHDTDGKFSSGNAYWKFKGGTDYIVSDVERPADAMAYVMAAHSHNCISMKSIPTEVLTLDQWEKELEALDRDYAVFLVEQAVKVSPLTQ